MAKKPGLIIVFCAALLFSGCKNDTDGIFSILAGFFAWTGQNWSLSTSAFLDTAAKAAASGDSRLHSYALFGLASTYLAQEEYDSALARLAEIGDNASPDIRSSVWYQTGIIAFRKGAFDQAARYFRKSLESDPDRMDAKINLELSRRTLEERKAKTAGTASGVREESSPDKQSDTIFNLIRKKEQDRWKNQEKTSPKTMISDY